MRRQRSAGREIADTATDTEEPHMGSSYPTTTPPGRFGRPAGRNDGVMGLAAGRRAAPGSSRAPPSSGGRRSTGHVCYSSSRSHQ
eukprot:6713042-Prymnesium_polylepis.1